jgi:hypothetical protein
MGRFDLEREMSKDPTSLDSLAMMLTTGGRLDFRVIQDRLEKAADRLKPANYRDLLAAVRAMAGELLLESKEDRRT